MSTQNNNSKSTYPHGEIPMIKESEADIDHVNFPDMADLMSRLRFSTTDGCIWLDQQRMLLVHAHAFGILRKELIENVGFEKARGMLTRMGYNAGVLDAQMARNVRPNASHSEMFVVGPQMHCLEGIGLSQPIQLEIDVEKGTHYGEFIWTHQVEDEEHLRHFPNSAEPSCWMQIGYASGYSSEFMGRPVLYREVECQSMGHESCRIIGKPVTDWGSEALHDLSFIDKNVDPVESRPNAFAITKVITLADQKAIELGHPVGISPGFNSVIVSVNQSAPTNATVLFQGETGVGKEVFAKTMHRLSKRRDEPFIALNCAAIQPNLIESELFGVKRGAYTGAMETRTGRFERANKGTLFLDEIGLLPMSAQGNLLRVLQEGELERLGDSNTIRVDVRIIAATNADLRQMVAEGSFREDLFYRLNVFPIRVPPLRERREDIPLLLAHFLSKYNRAHGRSLTGFTQRAIEAIMSYNWPGNIRELENVIERSVIMCSDNEAIDLPQMFTANEDFQLKGYKLQGDGHFRALDLAHPEQPTTHPTDVEIKRAAHKFEDLLNGRVDPGNDTSLDEIETLLLQRAVEISNGNVSAASRLLGITRSQLAYRLKHRKIEV